MFVRIGERLAQKTQRPPESDLTQIRPQHPAPPVDPVALRASALAFIQGSPSRRIPASLLRRALSSQTAHIGHVFPRPRLGEPIPGHSRPFHASPDRSEQLPVGAPLAVLACGKVDAASTFSRRTVTECAMPEKILSSARYIGGGNM